MASILVIEDDPVTASTITTVLEDGGHAVTWLQNGREAVERLRNDQFDLVTLDRMLPGLDGLSVVRRARALGVRTPVLMVSAMGELDERIEGLREGGDDYVVKPFATAELAIRVEVLLRRQRAFPDEGVLRLGAIEIDLVHRKVWVDRCAVQLLHKEFRLLEFLARHHGQTVTRRVIFEQVWGQFFEPSDNLISVHIGKLRKKLEQPGGPTLIHTVKGVGYRLQAA